MGRGTSLRPPCPALCPEQALGFCPGRTVPGSSWRVTHGSAGTCMCTCMQLGASRELGSASRRPMLFLSCPPCRFIVDLGQFSLSRSSHCFLGLSRGSLQAETHCTSQFQGVLVAFVLVGVELREKGRGCAGDRDGTGPGRSLRPGRSFQNSDFPSALYRNLAQAACFMKPLTV